MGQVSSRVVGEDPVDDDHVAHPVGTRRGIDQPTASESD
jgi:hypothetical protein